MANKFCTRKPLGVGEQLARVKGLYPDFKCRAKNGTLRIEGKFQPTSMSAVYRVEIEYRTDEPPQIRVLDPKLRPREEGGKIPHTYPGNRPCLYLPGSGEWSSEKSLAHMVIPWISEWLFYYETWHAIGEWLGGGVEPEDSKPIINEEKEKTFERTKE